MKTQQYLLKNFIVRRDRRFAGDRAVPPRSTDETGSAITTTLAHGKQARRASE